MKSFLWAAAAAFLVLTSGCVNRASAPAGLSATRPTIYKLGPGDKITISVYGEQPINGVYLVGPSGSISLPLLGSIPAQGKTVEEVKQEIVNGLSPRFILDPRVGVDIAGYRPFYILGEVGKPGKYDYAAALTLGQAVATAGGYTYRANRARVFLQRGDNSEVEVKLSHGQPFWILPGDTIRIGERYF